MQNVAALLRELWERLGPAALRNPSFAPNRIIGHPPERTRRQLFPIIFSDSDLSVPMVEGVGVVDDEVADRIRAEWQKLIPLLQRMSGWHDRMVAAYDDRAASTKIYPLGEDRAAKLLRRSHRIAVDSTKGDPQGADADAVIGELLHLLFDGFAAPLAAANVKRAIRDDRSRYQALLDAAWTAPVPINARPKPVATVESLIERLAGQLVISDGVGEVGDADEAAAIWAELVGHPGLDRHDSAHGVRVTDRAALTKPDLDAAPPDPRVRTAPPLLERGIRERISLLLQGPSSKIYAGAEDALERAIAASSASLGLATAPARAALLLSSRVAGRLAADQVQTTAADEALFEFWHARGKVRAILKRDPDSPVANTPPPMILTIMLGRLLRDELSGIPIDAEHAWQRCVESTHTTLTRLKARPLSAVGTTSSTGAGVERIDAILRHSAPARYDEWVRRMDEPPARTSDEYKAYSLEWNELRRGYLASRADDEPELALRHLPDYADAIVRIQRLRPE